MWWMWLVAGRRRGHVLTCHDSGGSCGGGHGGRGGHGGYDGRGCGSWLAIVMDAF